jgi:hypothetical protein
VVVDADADADAEAEPDMVGALLLRFKVYGTLFNVKYHANSEQSLSFR